MAFTFPGVCVPSFHVAPPSVLSEHVTGGALCVRCAVEVRDCGPDVDGFVGSYSTHEIVPLPLPRGVKVCSHVEAKTLAALAVSPTVVRRSCPEAAPFMTTLELAGEIAMAVIEPPVCCALLVLVN